MDAEKFKQLAAINVNEHTEKKPVDRSGSKTLTYLSWAWAWRYFKEQFPDATYTVERFDDNRPYLYDPNLGYMVFTHVTAGGETLGMWLPVMDANNRAMKDTPYQIKFKTFTATVAAATMTDINKTIMRCLTKNISMFGLGLYIYAGEDLPEDSGGEVMEQIPKNVIDDKQRRIIENLCRKAGQDPQELLGEWGWPNLDQEHYTKAAAQLQKRLNDGNQGNGQ